MHIAGLGRVLLVRIGEMAKSMALDAAQIWKNVD
jgi:hypothetical protein